MAGDGGLVDGWLLMADELMNQPWLMMVIQCFAWLMELMMADGVLDG